MMISDFLYLSTVFIVISLSPVAVEYATLLLRFVSIAQFFTNRCQFLSTCSTKRDLFVTDRSFLFDFIYFHYSSTILGNA